MVKEAFFKWNKVIHLQNLHIVARNQQQALGAQKLYEKLMDATDDRLKAGFNSLKANLHEANIKRRVILSLFRTNWGQIYNAFNKWKELLNDKTDLHAKTSDVHRQLEKVLKRRLKFAFEAIKEDFNIANDTRKRCLREMILRTTDKVKLYYHRWWTVHQNLKHIEVCRDTVNIFDQIKSAIIPDISAIFANEFKNEKKKAIIL